MKPQYVDCPRRSRIGGVSVKMVEAGDDASGMQYEFRKGRAWFALPYEEVTDVVSIALRFDEEWESRVGQYQED